MSALARFEEFVEELLEGSLAHLLRSPLQPAEMAKRLERAMESQQRVGVGVILVPNRYTVLVHPDDWADLAPVRAALERELARFIVERARESGFSLLARPRVTIQAQPGIRRGRLRVQAELASPEEIEEDTAELEWTPAMGASHPALSIPAASLRYLDREGRACRVPLDRPQVLLGRARDCDIILDDPFVSRHHARIVLRYGQFAVEDLGSTHGTFLNGQPVQECVLRPGDRLTLGQTELSYEEE
ncbi:MAG: FhaA domain-containing protein [Chloroflexia bacterium]